MGHHRRWARARLVSELAEVVAELTAVVAAEPFRERMRELLMLARPSRRPVPVSPRRRAGTP